MKAPIIACMVKLDTYTTVNKMVMPHELQLMSVRHGSDNVLDIRPTKQVSHELDMDHEYNRLRRTYGRDQESGRPWVEMAFGHQNEGRMEKSIINGTHFYAPEMVMDLPEPDNTHKGYVTPPDVVAAPVKATPKRKRPSRAKPKAEQPDQVAA